LLQVGSLTVAEGYDSILGESVSNGGNTLKNREVIVYDHSQSYPEFIVYFKRK
jgi:hypothetical protein